MGTQAEELRAMADDASLASPPSDDDGEPKKKRNAKTTPTSRRNLRNEDMPRGFVTVKKPKELVERGRLAPSLIAHVSRLEVPLRRSVYVRKKEHHEDSVKGGRTKSIPLTPRLLSALKACIYVDLGFCTHPSAVGSRRRF